MSEDKKSQEGGHEGRTINTGGGTYFEGQIKTEGGDVVGRDQTINYNYGTSTADLGQLFEVIYRQIEARAADPDVDKTEIVAEVKRIEAEAAKGEGANPNKVERWLGSLAQMAPDILDVVVASLTNPAAGVATVIRKIAQQAKRA